MKTEYKLSNAQLRVMNYLINGWQTYPGAGMAIHVNGKRVCNVDTMFSLRRMGLVEQIVLGGIPQIGQWKATDAGLIFNLNTRRKG